MSGGNKDWAYALMVREARGEQINIIAAQFWREALGYRKDQDAKKALELVKAKKQEAA